jgi:GNAT superfamily N-acetyltransferase
MTIETLNSLSPELLDFWCHVFSQPPEVFQYAYEAAEPSSRRTLAMRSEGAIVSSVQIYARDLRWIGGSSIKVGCIANVSTAPESRGQGLSRGLLTRSLDEMAEMGCSFSLLYTGIESFYHALGWRAVSRRTLLGAPTSQSHKPIAPTAAPEDMSPLRRLYESAYGSCPLTQVRSELHWANNSAPRQSECLFFQAPDAYVAAKEEEGRLVVMESGYAESAGGQSLLEGVIAWAGERGLPEIELRVPITPSCEQAAANALKDSQWVESHDGMVRPLDPKLPFESILAVCERQDARFLPLDSF